MLKALIILTPAESKALIGKAVAQLDVVKKALKEGLIMICRSSTNAFIAQELLGREIDKSQYISGFVGDKGMCVNHVDYHPYIVIDKGKLVEISRRYSEYASELKCDDVYIKSANCIDRHGVAGILAAVSDGGRIGRALGTVKARGVNFIVPAGLEKLIPGSVHEASNELGIGRLNYCMGVPVGLIPVYGYVVTEVEAIEILFGAEAFPVASGGINGAEGAATLIINGGDSEVKAAIKGIEGIKGEPPTKALGAYRHDKCAWTNCTFNPNHSEKRYLTFE